MITWNQLAKMGFKNLKAGVVFETRRTFNLLTVLMPKKKVQAFTSEMLNFGTDAEIYMFEQKERMAMLPPERYIPYFKSQMTYQIGGELGRRSGKHDPGAVLACPAPCRTGKWNSSQGFVKCSDSFHFTYTCICELCEIGQLFDQDCLRVITMRSLPEASSFVHCRNQRVMYQKADVIHWIYVPENVPHYLSWLELATWKVSHLWRPSFTEEPSKASWSKHTWCD